MFIPAPIDKNFVPYTMYRKPAGSRAHVADGGGQYRHSSDVVPQANLQCTPDCTRSWCPQGYVCVDGACRNPSDDYVKTYCPNGVRL